MCETAKIGNNVVFVCEAKPDHEHNELGTMYETADGQRHYFDDDVKAKAWYEQNWKQATTGSVSCTICGRSAFDDAYKIHDR